jgi:hypothetical protein
MRRRTFKVAPLLQFAVPARWVGTPAISIGLKGYREDHVALEQSFLPGH